MSAHLKFSVYVTLQVLSFPLVSGETSEDRVPPQHMAFLYPYSVPVKSQNKVPQKCITITDILSY